MIYGGRYSLLAGCLTVVIAGVIGTFYGAIAGYVGGWVEDLVLVTEEGCEVLNHYPKELEIIG